MVEWDFGQLNHRNGDHVESLFMLTREGQGKSLLHEYHGQRQAMSRFFLGAMMLTDPVLEVLRRELRRVSPGVKIEIEELRTCVSQEVIKREVLEGDKATEARRKIARVQNKVASAKEAKAATKSSGNVPEGQVSLQLQPRSQKQPEPRFSSPTTRCLWGGRRRFG